MPTQVMNAPTDGPEKLRVLVGFPWALISGGGQYTALTMANALARHGHAVTYCSEMGPVVELLDPRVKFVPTPLPTSWLGRKLYPFWPLSVIPFLRLALGPRFDIVHTYCEPTFVLGALIRVLRGTPCLFSALGPAVPLRAVCDMAGEVIACSKELRDKTIAKHGYPAERVPVIPNHIDLTVYRPGRDGSALLERYGLRASSRKIVVLGRIEEEKYQTIRSVLDAVPAVVKQVPDLEVVIVGDGKLREQAEREVATLNQQVGRRVAVVTGALIEVPQVLNLADIAVGIGRSAMEGMACQRPTLIIGRKGYAGTVSPESAEVLGHFNFAGRNLTEPSDPRLLVEAILRILTDDAYARSVGSYARQYAEKYFDAEQDVRHQEAMYRTALRTQRLGLGGRISLALALVKMFLGRVLVPRRIMQKLTGKSYR